MQDENQDVVMDVFRRHYYSDQGKPVSGERASHYGVMIRYLKTQEKSLLLCSGSHGVYLEPRTPDAQAPSTDFQVVWLQTDFPTIQHASQCEERSLGLARNGSKYGIRVHAADFQEVFQRLRPEALFLPPGKRSSWHCGPWPYGTDRKALAKVFRDWKWDARPLQPVHSVADGLMWLIQAITDPAETVYNMKHGQVVVTKCKSEQEKQPPAEVIGQPSTKQFCQIGQGVDVLQTQDPWKPKVQQLASVKPVDTSTQLQEIEQRLEKTLLAKLPVERMVTDDNEDRLQALERQMAQMSDRQTTLESTVQDHHVQNQAQVQSLQSQMLAQLDVQSRKMQGMLDDQLHRLESVIARRSRSRGRGE